MLQKQPMCYNFLQQLNIQVCMLHKKHIPNNWNNCVGGQDMQTYSQNNPTKINVFLSHQPFCECGIEIIGKCIPFMNQPTIEKIFPIVHYKFLDAS
jgi:hypothetical protein